MQPLPHVFGRNLMKQFVQRRLLQLFDLLAGRVAQRPADASRQTDRVAQIQLWLQYQALKQRGEPLPALADVEFSCYSQNGEDGILPKAKKVAMGGDKRPLIEI